MSIKITLADDHPIVLQGIGKILEDCKEVEILDTCRDGRALLNSIAVKIPDVLLLDVQMPGQPGDELAKIITRKYPQIAILALTNLNHTFHVRNMLLNGAKGYLLKSADQELLLHAIQTVYKGDQYIDESLREAVRSSNAEARTLPLLTKREKEVLELIADELTSQQIAQQLFVSLSTIENHRLNILFKLNVKNSVGMIRKAIQLGLIRSAR